MVPVAASRLTPIGFRRDIKLFLAALVGFLVVIILTLLVLLLNMTGAATSELQSRWRVAAESAADAIARIDPLKNRSVLDSQIIYMRSRFDIDGILVTHPGTSPIASGQTAVTDQTEVLTRKLPAGTVTFIFDATEMHSRQRHFYTTAIICLLAVIAGTILLLFYLPRITRPIESMLEQAGQVNERESGEDEASYLIDTFRTSIARLRSQETELKRLHEMERSRADDLQRITATLTRSLTSGFIALDGNGAVVDINQAARDILQMGDSDEVGKPVEEVFGESDFGKRLRQGIRTRQVVSRAEVNYQGSLEPIVIGLTTVPLLDETSRFLGLIALFADLTPIRRLESRVRDMQTLADLGEISAGIAHEFRNSLATILGYIKLAGRQVVSEEALVRLRKAEEEAGLLSGAVEGLLSFARPMKLDYGAVRLDGIVADIAERLRSSSAAIDFQLNLDATEIKGDRALLNRAVENILRNAVDAVNQGNGTEPRIVIRCGPAPHPFLEVSDNGIGVRNEDVPRLLLPFQSEKPNGMGLGLPLARKIVLLHGGSLEMTGTAGRGACVRVEFGENVQDG